MGISSPYPLQGNLHLLVSTIMGISYGVDHIPKRSKFSLGRTVLRMSFRENPPGSAFLQHACSPVYMRNIETQIAYSVAVLFANNSWSFDFSIFGWNIVRAGEIFSPLPILYFAWSPIRRHKNAL